MCVHTHVCIHARTHARTYVHTLGPQYICVRTHVRAPSFVPYERMTRYGTLNGSLKIGLVFLGFLLEVSNGKC